MWHETNWFKVNSSEVSLYKKFHPTPGKIGVWQTCQMAIPEKLFSLASNKARRVSVNIREWKRASVYDLARIPSFELFTVTMAESVEGELGSENWKPTLSCAPDFSVHWLVLLTASITAAATAWMKGSTAHELCHCVMYIDERLRSR